MVVLSQNLNQIDYTVVNACDSSIKNIYIIHLCLHSRESIDLIWVLKLLKSITYFVDDRDENDFVLQRHTISPLSHNNYNNMI